MIFFLVIFASGLILRPFYKQVSGRLDQQVLYFTKILSEKTGMAVSCEKISPSIITGLNVKNIILTDIHNGKTIVQIKKTHIRYNILGFITGKGLSAVKDLSIDGFILNCDEDNIFLKSLSEKKEGQVEKKDQSEKNSEILKNLEGIASRLPFDVFIRNVHFLFSKDDSLCDINLKKITLFYLQQSRVLQIKTAGTFFAKKKGKTVRLSFNANGSVTDDFEGSSFNLSLFDLKADKLSFNRMNLAAVYKNRTFDLRSLQNGYPLFLEAHYFLDEGDASVSLQAKNLSLKMYKNLFLSLSLDASYNVFSKNLNYKSAGNVVVPDYLYKGGFSGKYSIAGDAQKLTVNTLEITGENIDVDYSGSCLYDGIKLAGILNVNSLMLPNGGLVSTEVYFDPLEKGFMAFAPQLLLDDSSLTALQLSVIPVQDSVDFAFEVSDYSHYEAEKAGLLKIDGSYIGGTKYIQANLTSDGIYLDSALRNLTFFAKDKSSSDFKFLSDYVFNGELFFSTDLKQVSYNIPYAFVVNTRKEGQFFYLSLDGNDSSLNLTKFDFISGGKLVHLSALFEKSPDGSDSFFVADLNADTLPYHISGNVIQDVIAVNGDYGISFDLRKKGKRGFAGSFVFENLPVGAAGTIFTSSLESSFSYSVQDGISVKLSRLEVSEAGGKFKFNPVLSLKGAVSNYGIFMDAISYSDKFSAIEGKSELLWNINDSVFNSVSFNLDMKNPLSTEGIKASVDLSNPNGEKLSGDNIKKSFYLNSQIILNNFGLNRFSSEQSDNNSVTATLIASGVPENPYIGLNVDNFSIMSAGKNVLLSGSAFVEEKNLTVEKTKLVYNNLNLSDISALFDMTTFTGSAKASLDTIVSKQTLHAPLEFSVSDTVREQGKILPSEFAARLSCEKVSGTLLKKEFPFALTVLHSGDITSVYSSETQGISGTVEKGGKINFTVAEGKPVQMNLSGNTAGSQVDIALKNFSVDLGKIFEYVDIPRIKIYNGLLRGSLTIAGLKSDPEFMGSFSLSQGEFILPKIVTQRITIPRALMVFHNNVLELPEANGFVKKDIPVNASMRMFFDRWSFNRIEARIWNPRNVYMPGDFEIRLAHFIGNVSLDLNLAYEDHYLDVTGDVFLKKVTGSVKTRELALSPPKRSWFARTDVKIHFGQHVTFIFDPLLRAVLVPNTDLGLKYDMAESIVELDGELAFRSGDISYLSRNFYLKNGSMRFNSNDPTFNPLISIQAETRERDDSGNDVRIILTANNQYLLNFNAQFTSIPAKSETEIRALLGQIAVGDSDKVSSLLLATGDYAIQSTIGRSIENKLRDFLNFDILSVRTNVLQNALNYGLLERSKDSENSSFGLGNFFDNSTVYIGKYFGSSLYMDALMHWSYDETRVDDTLTSEGLVFRPEFGLEIEAPFGNLRWNMAPDINGLRNDRFVSSTSVTLSWKFSF